MMEQDPKTGNHEINTDRHRTSDKNSSEHTFPVIIPVAARVIPETFKFIPLRDCPWHVRLRLM